MIAPNIALESAAVVRGKRQVAQVMDVLRDEAALEIAAAFDGVSGKKIDAAGMVGFGRHGISRAANGSETNPLYRLAGIYILMKRLGIGREAAQRLVDLQQSWIDAIWGPAEEALEEVLEKDQQLDPQDDHPRWRASHGCIEAARELLDITRQQVAHKRTLLLVLRRRLSEV